MLTVLGTAQGQRTTDDWVEMMFFRWSDNAISLLCTRSDPVSVLQDKLVFYRLYWCLKFHWIIFPCGNERAFIFITPVVQ